MAHVFDRHNDSLSESGALAAVVVALTGKPYWKRIGTGCPRRLRHRGREASSVSAPDPARRTGGKKVVRATPPFSALVRHRGGVNGPP